MENYLYFNEFVDYKQLKKPAEFIKQGKIVIFPTETVYGIGTNALDKNAVKRLYDVKQRSLNKPISLLVSDMDMVETIAKDITDLEYKLMKEFFPGPFTIILKKKDIVPDIVTANTDTVGVRMPSEKIARKLIEYAKVPIAASSANISGKPAGTDFKNIIKDFEGKADYFIEDTENKFGIASTIVKVIDNVPYILREGSITKEQIEKIVGKPVIER